MNYGKRNFLKTSLLDSFLCFAIIFLIPGFLKAQYVMNGKYVDNTATAIPFANVLLLSSPDSALVKGEITDKSGRFSLATNKAGRFLIVVKFIGYEDFYSEEFALDEVNLKFELGNIVAVEKSQQLNAVIIEAEKPLFEQKIDRTVVNVASSIVASGGSVLDLLARSPGVTVDRLNMSVAMAGKQGVRIMINGKISQIPVEATLQMLAGLNAESIEKIELITTPPAKYEAEGDAGLINIVLQQQTDAGSNGNITVFSGYGRKEKYGGNINFNNRSKKVNLYGDYAYNNDVTEALLAIDRVVRIAGDQVRIGTDNNRAAYTRIHSGRLGADWNIGKKTTLGGIISIFDRHWEMDALANIKQIRNGSPSGFVDMQTFEINKWTTLIGNINYRHVFNEHHNLSVDVDHIVYNADNPTDYRQQFFDESKAISDMRVLRSRKGTPINTWVGKIDYIRASDKFTFEAGAKGSVSALENDIIVDHDENGSREINKDLTSYAEMVENIGAGYVSATIDASDKVDLKLGLRYEHTATKIDTREAGNVINRNFGGWFPSFFFQHTINQNNSWVFSYSRRITRPSFFQIAPFVIFLDPYSFWSGNISLLPAMTDAVKAEYRHKAILFSLQYSHDKNSIATYQPRSMEDGGQVSTAENMDYRNNFSINLSLPFNLTHWWAWQLNMAGNLINVRTDYLKHPIDITIKNFTLNGTQKFSLPNKFKAEITGIYQSKQLWGVMEMKAFGGVDLGLEKEFKHSQLRLAVTDLFNTNKWHFTTTIPQQNLDIRMLADFETRIIRVTYATSFGNRKLKVKKRDTTGSEEEQKRFK